MEIEVAKKLFTVDEYHRPGEPGIFHPEARLELIEGEILEMSPVGDRHIVCVNRRMLSARLAGKVMVSVQNPAHLSRYTEPRPDILLAPLRDDFYASHRLSAKDALLVIEISMLRNISRFRAWPISFHDGLPANRFCR